MKDLRVRSRGLSSTSDQGKRGTKQGFFNLEKYLFGQFSKRPLRQLTFSLYADQLIKIEELARRNNLDRSEVCRRLLDFALEALREQWQPVEANPVEDLQV